MLKKLEHDGMGHNQHRGGKGMGRRGGRGQGRGHGKGQGRGRPFKIPHLTNNWDGKGKEITLKLFDYELEVLKLIDLKGYTQEEVASKIKPQDDTLSRGNINRYLQNAREKVVSALLNAENISLHIIDTQNQNK